ncbi:hypothetical protein SERLADRAFT_377595 [Serpula lacrymans var. lacrymans S7.9]|uniref:Uncharacterized protein n=1 Tax=Serpula lacrymans var. lacrymans (strain S7.9) TaxID=578457 RepID=F8NHH7_SERL9|nr:uncharacterized protein SERLADRAFT_377595 [Serpula lacrymans var. lacrymans S7.9]EGO29148.1 hypothetical protein SERLADRAFT_377595 [Serpula lacrymans var. lacrymans S7.9]
MTYAIVIMIANVEAWEVPGCTGHRVRWYKPGLRAYSFSFTRSRHSSYLTLALPSAAVQPTRTQ